MKQITIILSFFVLSLSIGGCLAPNSSSSAPPPPSYTISSEEKNESSSSGVSISSDLSPSSESVSSSEPIPEQSPPDITLSKAPIVGAFRQDVDFLTDEQWALYDKGRLYLYRFLFDAGYFHGDSNTLFDIDKTINIDKTIDGWHYYQYSSEKYPSYDAFYQDMLTVYTPKFYEEHNKTPGDPSIPIYVNVDGALYYLDATGGANITYLPDWDRFELVSMEEDRIEFNLVAYYCERDDVSLENPIPVEMKRGPIVMEKTDDGWRISKFDYPN